MHLYIYVDYIGIVHPYSIPRTRKKMVKLGQGLEFKLDGAFLVVHRMVLTAATLN